MIFVSDMGDALSRRSDFPFLKREVIEPHRVGRWAAPVAVAHQGAGEEAELAEVGGLPPNVCVMTTVTSPATLWRIAALRKVKAKKPKVVDHLVVEAVASEAVASEKKT